MRRHAKAFAAASPAVLIHPRSGFGRAPVIIFLAFLGLLGLGSSAKAAEGLHPFKEPLGGSSTPVTFSRPLSLAVDRTSGDVLVVDAGVNEVQNLKVFATAGTYKLSFGGQTTGDIAWNATAATVKSALEGLSSIGVKTPASITVTPAGATGGATGGTPYVITFQNQLGGRDIETLTVLPGTTPLSGGSPGSEAVVSTPTPGAESGIRRFHADGSPSNFSALGTNLIDGQRGPGGKTGAECETAAEPASCDETPLNGFVFPGTAPNASAEIQVAVDTSGAGSPTDGNIYITQVPSPRKLVYVFDATGRYRGQITAAGATAFGEVCGVAAAPNGNLFVGQFTGKLIRKFIPTGNPPLNSDWVSDLAVPALPNSPCQVAAGIDSTLGSLFVAKLGPSPAVKFDSGGTVQYSFGSGRLVATNPTNGNVFVAGATAAGASQIGTEYDTSDSSAAIEKTTVTAGSAILGIAVGPNDNVYVSRAGSANIDVFGAAVFPPTVKAFAASEVAPTKATLNGSVNPQGDSLSECVFEYGPTAAYGSSAPCAETVPGDSSVHPVSASLTGLEPNGATYHYRLVAANSAGTTQTADRTFVTAATAITEAATGVTDTTATVNGSVLPEGTPVAECRFEYGTTTAYGSSKPCTPAAAAIEGDFQTHAVSADLAGLAKGTTYHFRLVTANAEETAFGEDLSFTTLGLPVIREELPALVNRTSATLQAQIDPNGFGTSYHFEWGPSTAYGNSTPADFEPFLGSGPGFVTVSAKLTGLTEGAAYHFRVVATNASGTVAGEDRRFETLNRCGFTQDRCLELVTPADKGPIGAAGEVILQAQPRFRPALSGGRVAYLLGYAMPDSTAGGEVVYQAERDGTGWSSSQLSAPSLEPSNSTANGTDVIRYLSDDLDCLYTSSGQRLTEDAPAVTTEYGGWNLFRRQADGTYTLLTPLPPANLENSMNQPEPDVVGASADCERVVFFMHVSEDPADFAGLAGGLYEWDHGELRSVSKVPGASSPVAAKPGAGYANYWNAMAMDCAASTAPSPCLPSDRSRVIFTATSQQGGDAGNRAIFLRERDDGSDSEEVRDISQKAPGGVSENLGAAYQTASTDGNQVFFLANYGLAGPSSVPVTPCSAGNGTAASSGTGSGCDLYRYTRSTETLTNLSSVANPANTAGAAVAGVLGASNDGSYVYFAARGQLVPNEGRTYQQNLSGSGHYNLYLSHEGELSYVGAIAASDHLDGSENLGTTMWNAAAAGRATTSRVTPDGRFLLFQSTALVTDYPGGSAEAYLYSADSGVAECISCRRDGLASVASPGQTPLPSIARHTAHDVLHPPLTLTEDGSHVFFWSPDVLASGAVEGEVNLYEWNDRQITLLTTGVEGLEGIEAAKGQVAFVGASKDATDLYFSTPRSLLSQDFDGRQDIYDARAGGGFDPPSPPPPGCDPISEGSCQGGAPFQQPPLTAPGSTTIVGSGNADGAQQKKAKKKHKKRKKQRKKKQKNRANSKRGASK